MSLSACHRQRLFHQENKKHSSNKYYTIENKRNTIYANYRQKKSHYEHNFLSRKCLGSHFIADLALTPISNVLNISTPITSQHYNDSYALIGLV